MKKILYILRHAKTETGSARQEDRERRLMPRGVEDARAMGKYLAAQGIRPDKVLCSTAVRTRETWAAMQPDVKDQRSNGKKDKSLPFDICPLTSVAYSDRLYLASANGILALLAGIPENNHSLMIIGHNPGLHELCLKCAKDGDHALLHKLAAKFPTCTLATIVFNNAKWHGIGHARGTLTGFITPKMLKD